MLKINNVITVSVEICNIYKSSTAFAMASLVHCEKVITHFAKLFGENGTSTSVVLEAVIEKEYTFEWALSWISVRF